MFAKLPNMPVLLLILLGIVVLLLIAGYAFLIEPYSLEVVRVPIQSARLPPEFAGITIAQISDFHIDYSNNQAKVHTAVDQVLAMKPDLILLTGDFVVSRYFSEAQILETELGRLSAPMGVYAILGNRDVHSDIKVIVSALQRAHITLLENTNVRFERGKASLYLAGLVEFSYGNPDLSRPLAGIPAGAPVILMAHEPDLPADKSSADGRIFLQVSGHTHGGQVRFFGKSIVLPLGGRKYSSGLFQVGSMQLYVNRGLGVTFPPLRLFCRPEISLFTLERLPAE